ncbi:MAG: hypothetical protein ACR2IF_08440 [Terriglobales bacterium]
MASNPQPPYPPQRPHLVKRDVHPKLQEQLQPQSRVPWVLIAIIVAAAILLALIIWLPRTPRAYTPSGAQVPAQPTGQQIQLTDVRLTPAPVGNAAYLETRLVNAGPTQINGVLVDVTFKGANGANVGTMRLPVEGIVGGSNTTAQPLTEAPIKPGEARPVRIALNNVPAAWDHSLPELSVAAVTAIGNPSNDKLGAPILNKDQSGATVGNKPQGSATEPSGGNWKSGGKPPKK